MSTSSALGESWVVTSVHAEKENTKFKNLSGPTPQTQTVREDGGDRESKSIAASISSTLGPELIMPSIYDTPISEVSWVAPTVRTKQNNPSPRRRHQSSAEPAKARKAASDGPIQGHDSTTTSKDQTKICLGLFETPIRTIANIILLAAISHLLILPELVQQYQTLCTINPILSLYPSSCVPRYPQQFSPHQRSQSTPFEAITSSQIRLEALFNKTLHEMAPLNSSLKQTESQLHTVEQELKRAHPGTKHELDLEFESCWRAIRIAAWKYDSLKVDLQSAVDSLVATGNVKPTDSRPSVAHDARISTQMLRREQYLDQLTARMRSKADSLAADLATLDDHLESIEGIVNRESIHARSSHTYLAGSSSRKASSRLVAFVDAIVPPSISRLSFLRTPGGVQNGAQENTSPPSPELTLSQVFDEATTHHPPVAELARNLSKQLQQSNQNKRGIP